MKLLNVIYPAVFLISTFLFAGCNPEEEIIRPAFPRDSARIDYAALAKDTVEVEDSLDTLTMFAAEEFRPAVDSANYRYGKSGDMPYRILYPRNYDSTRTYPMLVFLHGIGERGSDNEKQLTWGASVFQADSIREKYPAFVVFPQCKTGSYWFDSGETGALKGMIDDLQKKLPIANGEIIIGGLSMGAYGTYAMVSRYPGLFTAAVAISGDGDASRAGVMSHTRWRIFAGKKDRVVSSAKSEKMAAALTKSGASVSFTLYPDADHTASWVKAFAEPDFCAWMFSSFSKSGR